MADDVDHELIKETLSYEMVMTLAIFYNHMLVKEKEEQQQPQNKAFGGGGEDKMAAKRRRSTIRTGGSF